MGRHRTEDSAPFAVVVRYTLVVLTHGDAATLEETLAAFAEHVTPREEATVIVYDGVCPDWLPVGRPEQPPLSIWCTGGPLGFCDATRFAWRLAAQADTDWIFWLEGDFVFQAPVDLDRVGYVLEDAPQVAQMAFRRQPVSVAEYAAGGYVETRPECYREWFGPDGAWLEHDLYWTTNPSLFRRALAVRHEWPAGPECEGRFAFQLREEKPGTTFGLWGNLYARPLVAHIGTRTGKGY